MFRARSRERLGAPATQRRNWTLIRVVAAAGLLFYLLLPAASGAAANTPDQTSPSVAPSPTDALVTEQPMPTGSPPPTATATEAPTSDPTATPEESGPVDTPEPTAEPTDPATPGPTESPPDEATPSPSDEIEPTPAPTESPPDEATPSPSDEIEPTPAPTESPPETIEPDPTDDPPTLTPEPTASPTEEPIAEVPPSEIPTPEPTDSATPPADDDEPETATPEEVVEEAPPTDEAPAPAVVDNDPVVTQEVAQPAAPAPMPTPTAQPAAGSVAADGASGPIASVQQTDVFRPDLAVLGSLDDGLSHVTDVMADQSAKLASEAAIPSAVVLGASKMPNALAVAVEFGRAGNGWAGALVFNVWLRRQLRERRMTQRQLAAMSGVNHSTISRLLTNGRAPSLETATKLAHALRHRWSDEQVATYFDLLAERPLMPTQRVESALRGDDDLSEDDVRALMEQYLVARAKRRQQRTAGGGGYQVPLAAVAGNRRARGRGAPAGRPIPPARR